MQTSGGELNQNTSLLDSDEYSLESNNLIIEINNLLAEKNYVKLEEKVHILININCHPKFKLKLAHFLYIQGKSAQAEEVYKELLPVLPENLKPEALFGLGQANFDMKEYLQSHLAFSLLLNSYPDFVHICEVQLKLGRISYMLNDSAGSIEYIKKVISNKSSSRFLKSEALVLLAQIKEKEGSLEKSLIASKRALGLYMSFRSVIANAYYFLMTDPTEAEALCLRSLRYFKDESEWNDILFFRSVAFIKIKDFGKAIHLLKSQLAAVSQNYLYCEYLGIAYLMSGDFARAFEVFQKVREFRNLDCTNLKNLAYCCKAFGCYDEALCALEIVYQVEGNRVGFEELGITEPKFEIDYFPSNKLSF